MLLGVGRWVSASCLSLSSASLRFHTFIFFNLVITFNKSLQGSYVRINADIKINELLRRLVMVAVTDRTQHLLTMQTADCSNTTAIRSSIGTIASTSNSVCKWYHLQLISNLGYNAL